MKINNALEPGNPADITIVDLNGSIRLMPENFSQRVGIRPFDGWEMKGKAVLTMVVGKSFFSAIDNMRPEKDK